ncbi:N-acetyl-glucosamine-6-phosphate deacetylase [Massospora cicadina]|nr:N-acetyl-glucosamine-6-phosphate deacetylase [Massospora cicadina]
MSPPSVELEQLNEKLSKTSIEEGAGKIIKIVNGRILRDHQIILDDYLWIRDGKIIDPVELFWTEKATADVLIDANNALLVPGYIELQINGAFGVDFTGDCDTFERGLSEVSIGLLKQGTTAFCPTIVSSRPEVYAKVLPYTSPRAGSAKLGAEILGAHLEGPFISNQKYGAHEVATLRDASNGMEDLNQVYGLDKADKASIAIVTVAPDIPGMLEVISRTCEENPAGHSPATTNLAELAVERGAKMVTHMFNAMQQFHHRDPGIIGLLGSPVAARPFYGIICDGIHVHPNSIKIAYYSHPNGVCLVTDAMSAMGLPEGSYVLGNMEVEVTSEGAYISGTKTLAGSAIRLDECVRNFKKYTGCSIVEAIEAATLHPAQALGIAHRKGTLNYGCDADILFLDDDLHVKRVFVNGQEACL